MPEDLVDSFVSFYWKEIRLRLVNLRYNHILLTKLGTFSAKPWKIEDIVDEYHNKHNYITKPDTIKKYEAKKTYLKLYNNAKKMADRMKQEQEEIKTHKQLRRNYGKEDQH